MKRLGLSVCIAVVFFGCSHSQKVTDTSQIVRVPAAEVRLANYETALNTEVYWGGSEEAEAEVFKKMAEEIRQVIHRQTAELRGQSSDQRGFHAKSHACLRGNLILDSHRPADTRKGLFADGTDSYKFWGRFSNGVGWHQGDNAPDVRGLSLKVLGVPGVKFMTDEKETQDFVMINSPVGFGADAREFMDFAQANSRHGGLAGQAASGGYATTHPRVFTAVHNGIKSTLAGIPSLSLIQYWGGTPYRLGADRAMKYTVKPEPCAKFPNAAKSSKSKSSETKFRDDLYARSEKGFCMSLSVQFQDDAQTTPIEDASIEWKTPFVKVATLEFFPQKLSADEKAASEAMCDKMSFNPWHSIEDHRPLGNQNRARRWVYDSSRENRHGGQAVSPFPDWEIK